MDGRNDSCAYRSSAPATSVPPTPPAWPSSATRSSASTSTRPKVATLQRGEAPFYEPGLEPLLRKHVEAGRLRFTTDLRRGRRVRRRALPLRRHPAAPAQRRRRPELRRRRDRPARRRTCAGPALVVGKSTVPVGTAERLPATLARARARRRRRRAGLEPGVPPRGLRRRGHAPPRPAGVRRAAARGPSACCARSTPTRSRAARPVVVTDFATAELVKVSANAFLATKISFINAMAEVCEASRRRRRRRWPTRSGTTPGSAGSSSTPASASAAAACPRTSGPSCARAGELGRRTRRSPSCARSTRSTSAAATGWSSWPASCSAAGSFAGTGSPCWVRRSSRDSDDVRDSPALDVAGGCTPRARSVTVYDPRPTYTPADRSRAALRRHHARGRAGRGPGAAPDGVAGVPRRRPGRARRVVARPPSSTAQLPRPRRLDRRRLDVRRTRPLRPTVPAG